MDQEKAMLKEIEEYKKSKIEIIFSPVL